MPHTDTHTNKTCHQDITLRGSFGLRVGGQNWPQKVMFVLFLTAGYTFTILSLTLKRDRGREIAVGVHLIREIGVNSDTRHTMIDETVKFKNILFYTYVHGCNCQS